MLCQIARTFERAPLFPMTNIHDLGMTDTEYAKLLAQGYKPNLEYQLVKLGESIEQARKLAREWADQRQTTPDWPGMGRIYGSLGGLVLFEVGEGRSHFSSESLNTPN